MCIAVSYGRKKLHSLSVTFTEVVCIQADHVPADVEQQPTSLIAVSNTTTVYTPFLKASTHLNIGLH